MHIASRKCAHISGARASRGRHAPAGPQGRCFDRLFPGAGIFGPLPGCCAGFATPLDPSASAKLTKAARGTSVRRCRWTSSRCAASRPVARAGAPVFDRVDDLRMLLGTAAAGQFEFGIEGVEQLRRLHQVGVKTNEPRIPGQFHQQTMKVRRERNLLGAPARLLGARLERKMSPQPENVLRIAAARDLLDGRLLDQDAGGRDLRDLVASDRRHDRAAVRDQAQPALVGKAPQARRAPARGSPRARARWRVPATSALEASRPPSRAVRIVS